MNEDQLLLAYEDLEAFMVEYGEGIATAIRFGRGPGSNHYWDQ